MTSKELLAHGKPDADIRMRRDDHQCDSLGLQVKRMRVKVPKHDRPEDAGQPRSGAPEEDDSPHMAALRMLLSPHAAPTTPPAMLASHTRTAEMTLDHLAYDNVTPALSYVPGSLWKPDFFFGLQQQAKPAPPSRTPDLSLDSFLSSDTRRSPYTTRAHSSDDVDQVPPPRSVASAPHGLENMYMIWNPAVNCAAPGMIADTVCHADFRAPQPWKPLSSFAGPPAVDRKRARDGENVHAGLRDALPVLPSGRFPPHGRAASPDLGGDPDCWPSVNSLHGMRMLAHSSSISAADRANGLLLQARQGTRAAAAAPGALKFPDGHDGDSRDDGDDDDDAFALAKPLFKKGAPTRRQEPWTRSNSALKSEARQESSNTKERNAACPRQDQVVRVQGINVRMRDKAINTTSKWRGVTKHRVTGRYEAQLWDATAVNKDKSKGGRARGRQVYLGGYASEEEAAEAYDRAAIKFFGDQAKLNFKAEKYDADIELRKAMTRDEWVAHLRSQSAAFSRGLSKYRGVTKHHHGKWEARISGFENVRYTYLGTFASEQEAARAYDMASIASKQQHAIVNFPITDYLDLKTGQMKEGIPWKVPAPLYSALEKMMRRKNAKKPVKGECYSDE